MKREQILRAIEGSRDAPAAFLKLLEKHASAEDALDLSEFFQALPRKQHARVWSAVLTLVQDALRTLDDGEGGGGEGEKEGGCEGEEVLSGVVTLCQCALSLESPVVPSELTDTLQTLHDVLLSVPAEWCELQNEMSGLCELCWGREVEGREGLVPNCLLYVIARTFSQGATRADVGRVWAIRGALLLLDFEDTSADSIKQLLLSALIEPLYLLSDDGKKLLSFLFGLHPSFVEDLHCAVRNQLPWCPKSHLEVYGDVYFRAWRLASGPYLKQLEEHCLQDLMYCAVHAQRTGPHSLFAALRKLLGYIHQQRQHKGVSEMLLRLYNPFLWRSLKVANPHVRANAAVLMLDAFPLHDPDSTREECDTTLQKQFDLMTDLLADTSPMVRSLTTLGVCRVLCRYWEMIPLTVVRTLLLRLTRDLAYDTASDNVRVAVIQGLCVVLENRLSHVVLQDLLPLLRTHIHDTSEKVRVAFLDLLLVVNGLRSIKFYNVCPLEDLLVRMETDSVHVVKRIVALLINSFQPSNVPPYRQVARCLALLEMNAGAARRFYQLAVGHLTPSHTVRFMLALHKTVSHCVEEGEEMEEGREVVREKRRDDLRNHVIKDILVEGDDEAIVEKGEGERGEGERGEGVEGDPTGIAQGGWKEEGEGEGDSSTRDSLSLADRDVIAGVLEVLVVLWEGVRQRLGTPKHRTLRSKLESTVAESLPLLFNALTDGRCRSALYLLASYLPRKSVAAIMKGTLQTLSTLDQSSQDYSVMLVAMTSWKQCGHVVRLISQWLGAALQTWHSQGEGEGEGEGEHAQPDQNHKRTRGKSKNRGKAVGGRRRGKPDASCPQSMLALNMLNYMMVHPLCCEELKKQKETWELDATLQQSLDLLEAHFLLSSEAPPPVATFDLLREAVSVYLRLALHRGAESGGENEAVRERFEQIMRWSHRIILPLLRGEISQPATRHSNRKRKASQSQPSQLTSDPRAKEARQLTELLLGTLADAVLIGQTDSELQAAMAQWAAVIAGSASGPLLLRPLCKMLFQLSEASTCSEVEGIKSVSSLVPTATLLLPLLQLSANTASASPDDFKKVWSQLQMCVGSVVTTSLRQYFLSLSSHPLPTLTTLTSVTMSSLVDHFKERPTLELACDVSSLPLFPCAVLRQVCKDERSTSVFASHLHSWLEEGEGEVEAEAGSSLPDHLLRHKSAICVVSALASSEGGGGELVRCVRCTLRLVERAGGEETGRWYEEIQLLSQSVEMVQEKLFH